MHMDTNTFKGVIKQNKLTKCRFLFLVLFLTTHAIAQNFLEPMNVLCGGLFNRLIFNSSHDLGGRIYSNESFLSIGYKPASPLPAFGAVVSDNATTVFLMIVNDPPQLVSPISDISLTIDGNSFERSLYDSPFVFVDPDGDVLSYSATSFNPGIAIARILGGILNVSPVAIGSTKVALVARDFQSDTASATFNVTVHQSNIAPSITNGTILGTQYEGEAIPIIAKITDDSGISDANLYYRKGGAKSFRKTALRIDGRNSYAATIPEDEVTSRGIEYYFDAINSYGLKSRLPLVGVYVVQVLVSPLGLVKLEPQPGGSEKTSYRLISTPLDLDDKNPERILKEEFGPYNKKQWRLYSFTESQNLIEFPEFSEIKSGQAYWLIVKEKGKRISTGNGRSKRTDSKFSILLYSKWNLIANPYNFAIPLSNVTLEVLRDRVPIEISIDHRKIRTFLGYWNNSTDYYEQITELNPFEGYAIFNDSSSTNTLLINPDLSEAPTDFTKSITEAYTLWSIHIISHCEEARDIDNVAAIVTGASSQWDEMDQPEPPPIGEYVSVYFPHREWNTLAKTYCIDARPEPTEGEVWDFEVKTNIRDKVNLTFEGIASVPSEFEVWLVDEALQITQNLREQKQYAVAGASANHPKQLKLVVGKRGFIDEQLAGAQAIPATFELSQNFPNPFNPVTTIRYGLPQNARVTLKLYNLLGEEVVTLVDNEQKAVGYHAAIWNGRNRLGHAVSSGLYLYRMQAGDFVAVRKMALVR